MNKMSPEKKWVKSWSRGKKKTQAPLKNKATWVLHNHSHSILARGFEVSKKPFPFTNTEEGFESFVSWIYNLAAAHKLTKIMVAIEPTGHYWFAFVAFLKKYDVQVVLVAPQHVKHSKIIPVQC